MDPLIGLLVGTGLVGGLSAGNSALGMLSSKQQVWNTKELMNHQFNLQRNMINNYHQWNTSSLRAAGLNPLISAAGSNNGGSFGATAAAPELSLGTAGDILNSAQKAATIESEIKTAEANADKAENEADIAQQQAINNWDLQSNEIRNSALQGDVLAEQKKQLELENQQLKFTNSALKADSDFYKSGWGKAMRFVDRTLEPFKGIVGGSVNKNYNTK